MSAQAPDDGSLINFHLLTGNYFSQKAPRPHGKPTTANLLAGKVIHRVLGPK